MAKSTCIATQVRPSWLQARTIEFHLSAFAGTTNRESEPGFRLQDANNGYFLIFVPSAFLEMTPAAFSW